MGQQGVDELIRLNLSVDQMGRDKPSAGIRQRSASGVWALLQTGSDQGWEQFAGWVIALLS